VLAAEENENAAAERLAKLTRAERGLNAQAKEIAEKMAQTRAGVLEGLIESAGENAKLDFKPLAEMISLEHRARYLSRAIEHLVENLLPLARVTHLREQSHAGMVQAKALEQVAQERAEKLLHQLREAVSEEVVLPVDLSKGVSGALVAQAAEYRRRAVTISENADKLEQTYVPRA